MGIKISIEQIAELIQANQARDGQRPRRTGNDLQNFLDCGMEWKMMGGERQAANRQRLLQHLRSTQGPYTAWNLVEQLAPLGYMELQDDSQLMHGPIESLWVDSLKCVNIILAWVVIKPMDETGMPSNQWGDVIFDPEIRTLRFHNTTTHGFFVEDVPFMGTRIIFDSGQYGARCVIHIDRPSPLVLAVKQ